MLHVCIYICVCAYVQICIYIYTYNVFMHVYIHVYRISTRNHNQIDLQAGEQPVLFWHNDSQQRFEMGSTIRWFIKDGFLENNRVIV